MQQAAQLVSPCSASAKWPTVHSSHGALCGKWNTTTAKRPLSCTLTMPAYAAVPLLPSCFLQLRACVCACVRWSTTVYELALLFNLVQFHLKLSSVRLLARSANINSSSTATTHTQRRPHNTFATVVRRCFCFSRFVLLIFSLQIYQNLESCNQVRARQTPLKQGEESN